MTKQLILKSKEDRRIIAGHPWAFSNEVRELRGDPQAGDVVELRSAGGKFLGVGFYNPHSLIAFRMLSREAIECSAEFFTTRIEQALDLRRRLYPESATFRLVHGESDFLPGMVVDKFNNFISLQTYSYGMDIRLPMICDVLESLLHPQGIVERNESPLRSLEGLPIKKAVLRGSVEPTIIDDCGVRYRVNVVEGQKTGFFLDQRENRVAVRRYCKDADVLDCFCNEGGFALHALRGGARSVFAIDASADAIAQARENAALNGLHRIQFEHEDVFDALKRLAAEERKFDVVILDPPSFTKTKKHVQQAKQGYKELHSLALRVLHRGGILATASCSHHILPEVFLTIIDGTARKMNRTLQLLDWRSAAPDHPILPQVPETRYLKFGIFRAL
ncbi:MAG: class I SAM-dependent rRNA methyltransferase [Ignavibacteria bacterium]